MFRVLIDKPSLQERHNKKTMTPYWHYFRAGDAITPIMQANLSTISQFIGIPDKEDREICNGDILDWDHKEWGEPYVELVTWDYELFATRLGCWPQFCTVIGNKYENPELLEYLG